jgi:hypothetical protein
MKTAKQEAKDIYEYYLKAISGVNPLSEYEAAAKACALKHYKAMISYNSKITYVSNREYVKQMLRLRDIKKEVEKL